MPYKVISKGSQFCVVKQADDSEVPGGCHATKADAEKHMAALYASENKMLPAELIISSGGAVKAFDDGSFELCMYKFTDASRKDLTHEYFSDATDFVDTSYPFTSKLLFHHGLDEEINIHPIGEIISAERRPGDGIYGKGIINFAAPYKEYLKSLNQPSEWVAKQSALADDYENMLKVLARHGKLAGSGGALPQSVVVDDDGGIKRWCPIEYTLTPSPAEPEYTRLISIKGITPVSLRGLIAKEAESVNETAQQSDSNDLEGAKTTPATGDKVTMNLDELKQVITEIIAPLLALLKGTPEAADIAPDAVAADMQAAGVTDMSSDPELMKSLTREKVEERMQAIAQQVISKAVKAQFEKREKAAALVSGAVESGRKSFVPAGRAPMGGFTARDLANPLFSVDNLKYASLSSQDMLLGHEVMMSEVPEVLRRNMKSNQIMSEEYLRHMVGKTIKYVEKQKFTDYGEELQIKSVMKANEVDTTANTGFGPEWVGQVWSSQIWEKARVQRVWEALSSHGMRTMEVPEGASTLNIQTESTDPTAFSYPQSADLDSTNRPAVNVLITPFATGTVPLTPGPIGMASAYSVIEEEDSVIPIAQQLNYQFDQKMQETIEQVIFNGDTATGANTNINLINGTPGTGVNRPYYLASNGILKYPLVTNTALSRDANASLALNDYRATLALIAPQFQTRLQNLLWAVDPYVQIASLALPELETDDVRRFNATITSGVITNLYGIDYVQSGFILKSNNAGKVPSGGGTLGRLALIFAPYWVLGWKRRIKVETGYDVLAQTKVMVATMRLGAVNRGVDAAAISYNVGIS